ncbi:putative amidophosphoribosyltransferase [Nocardia transvalensis]|uniref:Putative amidophosphoribosyltransferase n=1 Tax=Nocardia transvalensis TaxID=37333 RepID=A0A7W9UGI7_9NOCA|nr:ComF family protein [Nocardia transvalensis]MBB5912334.1 putative amidophosphoribosyltransferase [Nocardia transvalensis]
MPLDLILPRACGGCARLGALWCGDCAASLAGPPVRVRPRTDPGVPCWALGPYAGPARRAVLAAKECGRRDLAAPLGLAVARGLAGLRARGRPLVLVPAPSRRAAARRRGGDPVTRTARVASGWLPDCRCAPVLATRRGVRDSVGLSPDDRRHNLRGGITIAGRALPAALLQANAEVVIVDDVLTTAATVAEAVRTLDRFGVAVRGVLVTCAA